MAQSTSSSLTSPFTQPHSAPTSPSPAHESNAPIFISSDSDAATLHASESEPLYTEINIPLPRLLTPVQEAPHTPTSASPASQASHSLSPPPSRHHRSRSLSSFSPFRARSSSVTTMPERLVKPSILKSREVAAAMDLGHQSKRGRSSTIDALAVVPAVLVLSAELFTPGEGEGGKRRGGMQGAML